MPILPHPMSIFSSADSMAIPFGDNTFDVIVCNQIYEHVPDAKQMMEEIYRVLKKQGFCYFAAGNRYMIVEGHYGLPFLSWLPNTLGHVYLRWAGKGSFYYEKHLSLRKLRHLVGKFQVHDYTLRVIQDPERFSARRPPSAPFSLSPVGQTGGSPCLSVDSDVSVGADEEVKFAGGYGGPRKSACPILASQMAGR